MGETDPGNLAGHEATGAHPERPLPEKPGFLVEIDAVHEGISSDRLSAYALIDVCSRWAKAFEGER